MFAGTCSLRNGKEQARGGSGMTGSLRGSTVPWSTLPPGPEAYITLVPKDGRGQGTGTGVRPWQDQTGGNIALHGSTNPNFTSTLTRAPGGAPPAPLASSLHHGPDALRQPFNKWSTAKNCLDSWEARTQGSRPRGTDAPWASMRNYTAPATSLPPGPGWTYPTRNPADITSSSTASTNVASWNNRLDTTGGGSLLGSRSPNTTMRVPPSGTLRSSGGPSSSSAEFNTTSTAENDLGSWAHRQASSANGKPGMSSGQYKTDSKGRLGATFGTNYQQQRKPDITPWSTAAVDKDSWEHRVSQAFPDHLTFASTTTTRSI